MSFSSALPVSLTAAEVALIRADFPYFAQQDALLAAGSVAAAYLDSAATAQRPLQVIRAEQEFLASQNAAVHRGTSGAVGAATASFEAAREQVAQFVGANSAAEIVWASSATDALNTVAAAIGEASLGNGLEGSEIFALAPGDEILVPASEHHANLVPWQRLARKTGAKLCHIPVDSHGCWGAEAAAQALNSRTKIFAFAQVSNVTGLRVPVAELTALARKVGAFTVLDACQSAPHLAVDFAALGVDFAAFSAHKMFGPYGLGVLYGREELLTALPPARTGGSAITRVTLDEAEFMPPPYRFEPGTQAVSQAVAFASAIDYLEGIGMARISAREAELVAKLCAGLRQLPGVRVLGPVDDSQRVALAAFHVSGLHAHDLGQFLDQRGVLVRVGHHCAQPLHRQLGLTASTRASVHVTTTAAEIDELLAAIPAAQHYFGVGAQS